MSDTFSSPSGFYRDFGPSPSEGIELEGAINTINDLVERAETAADEAEAAAAGAVAGGATRSYVDAGDLAVRTYADGLQTSTQAYVDAALVNFVGSNLDTLKVTGGDDFTPPLDNEIAPTLMRFDRATRMHIMDGSNLSPSSGNSNPALWVQRVVRHDATFGSSAHDVLGGYFFGKALGSGNGATPADGTWIGLLGNAVGGGTNTGSASAQSWDRRGNIIGVAGFARTEVPGLTCALWAYASSPAMDDATWASAPNFPTIGMEVNVDIRHPQSAARNQFGGKGVSTGILLYNFQFNDVERRDWNFGMVLAGSQLTDNFGSTDATTYSGFQVGILLDRIRNNGILFGPFQFPGSYGIRFPDTFANGWEPLAAIHLGNGKMHLGQYFGTAWQNRDFWHNGGNLFFRYGDVNERLLTDRAGLIEVPSSAIFGSSTGTRYLQLTTEASAVNYLRTISTATARAPVLYATGTDPDVPLELRTQGLGRAFMSRDGVSGSSAWLLGENRATGNVDFTSLLPLLRVEEMPVLRLDSLADGANNLRIVNGGVGIAPHIGVEGPDANISLELRPRNTGVVFVGGTRGEFRANVYRATPRNVDEILTLTAPLAGMFGFADNGRKPGEGAGLGTGVLVYYDGTNWISVHSAAPVTD